MYKFIKVVLLSVITGLSLSAGAMAVSFDQVASIEGPATIALIGFGLAGLVLARRKQAVELIRIKEDCPERD